MYKFPSLIAMLKTSSWSEIVEQGVQQVKTTPQNAEARKALFKIYCVEGLWAKALIQLQTLVLMDESFRKQGELYKNLVLSEMQRCQVLTGERSAATLGGPPPPWICRLTEANRLQALGKTAESDRARSEAFAQARCSHGSSDAGEFAWIADSDGRLGPVMEFIFAGGYRWVPFSDLKNLTVSPPVDILHLLWVPAILKQGEEECHGYIPARYPIHSEDKQNIKLGFQSQWRQLSDILTVASGRKVLITDQSELSILEAGTLRFG